jgi:hypothetical protein
MRGITRRQFMKQLGAAGAATALPTLLIRRAEAAWSPGSPCHPRVDDLRVVGLTDPAMTRPGIPPTWSGQEDLVDREAVWDNLDRLACTLAATRPARDAWRTLFVKPPGKAWADTTVAVKTNQIGRQHARSAVVSRVCRALVDDVGVRASSIHIYDACHGGGMARQTPFAHLPEGVRLEGDWGGSSARTRVPPPWEGGTSRCLEPLVNGTVDILVNIAVCKGHSSRFGGFTMTMKNHFGTFSPGPGHGGSGFDYLLAVNRSQEILGPVDPKSGRVITPRQQLCIVDALWASEDGPGCLPQAQPDFLAMGVFSPAVDYVVATAFREGAMGWSVNRKAAERMLETFGYRPDDLPEQGRIIEP